MKVNPLDCITLCRICKRNFEVTGDNYIRRVNRSNARLDTCDVCQVRLGYDYKITPKQQKEAAQ